MNALYREAERLGIEVHYDAEVIDLEFEVDTFKNATVKYESENKVISAATLVAASGGFESNRTSGNCVRHRRRRRDGCVCHIGRCLGVESAAKLCGGVQHAGEYPVWYFTAYSTCHSQSGQHRRQSAKSTFNHTSSKITVPEQEVS